MQETLSPKRFRILRQQLTCLKFFHHILIPWLIVFCIYACKSVDSSKSSGSDFGGIQLHLDSVRLFPSEALVKVKVIEQQSTGNYLVGLEDFKRQSFGFSSYLTNGDSILIRSQRVELQVDSTLNVIIKDRPNFGGNSPFDFRLIDRNKY